MKFFFPLFPLLIVVCCFALIGCGGRPQTLNPTTLALPATPPASPAPANLAPNAPGNAAPTAAPAPVASSAPAPPAPVSSPQPAASSNTQPAGANANLPTPPDDAIVFDQIQNTSDDWKACSLCAQGTHSTDNYWMAPNTTSPSMTGSSRELYIGGPQWSNALFIKTLTPNNSVSHFLWDFWVYWDPASMANIWTAEFDLWQSIGGREFMIGSQCNFGDGWWDIWDSKNNVWLHSDIRCERLAPEQWHHIQWYADRPDDTHYRYNSLVVDGKSYDVNRTYEVNSIWWPDNLGVQWQLDQDMHGHDLHEWIDKVKLTAW